MSQSLFDKVAGLGSATLFKKTPTLVFCCEFYENFKNNSFTEHTRVTASVMKLNFLNEIKLYLCKKIQFKSTTIKLEHMLQKQSKLFTFKKFA